MLLSNSESSRWRTIVALRGCGLVHEGKIEAMLWAKGV